MTTVYADDIKTALELIAEFGADCQLKVFTATTPDPAQPWETAAPTEQVANPRMVFLNFKGNNSGETYWNGTLVQQGDKKVLLAASGLAFPPNLNALLTRADGSVWKVVNLHTLDPDGTPILYTMQVRK
jgi:hypothetical protein